MIKVIVTSILYLWPIGEHTDSIEFLVDFETFDDSASRIGKYILTQPSAADIRVSVDHIYDPFEHL